MVLLGLQLVTITLPGVGAMALGPEGVVLTIGITLLTVNAINFVDGLDGLAAGVGAIAALAFFAFSYALASGGVTGGVARTASPRRPSSPSCWPARAWASCRTTSTRRGSSWATPARCSSA